MCAQLADCSLFILRLLLVCRVVSYVRKRPGVDHFLRYCAEKFEVVVFTASLAKYADPLLDILDRDHTVRVRLFREACVQHYGNYVKVRHSDIHLGSELVLSHNRTLLGA